MTAVDRSPMRAAWIPWRRALGYALLWALAFGVLESLVLPVGELGWRQMLAFTLSILPI